MFNSFGRLSRQEQYFEEVYQDTQSIPMSPADCKIAAMLTTVVAISFFMIKEIDSNTKSNTKNLLFLYFGI